MSEVGTQKDRLSTPLVARVQEARLGEKANPFSRKAEL